jgi:hypothetical protein
VDGDLVLDPFAGQRMGVDPLVAMAIHSNEQLRFRMLTYTSVG